MIKYLYNIVLIAVLVLLTQTQSFAEIVSASIDNGVISISGMNLGDNSLETEWVGQNIESGTVDSYFVKDRWTIDEQGDLFQSARYTDTKSHSGNKSILCELPIQSQYNSGMIYDNGSRFNTVYISYWVYFDHVNSAGQWKMWRIRPVDNFGDTDGEIMASNWYLSDGSNSQNYVYLLCDTENYEQCYPNGISDLYGDASDLLPIDTWVRVEIYADGSSIDGAADGSLRFSWQIPGNAPHILRDYRNSITTRLSGTEQWRYFTLQNYWGNISVGTGTEEKFYFDDIFIQIGSQARVEIGDNAVFANCTHREIQPALTWSDTSITGTFNQGSFNNGDTVYFFVVDEDGIPSDGYAVTIGGEPSIADPVVEILTESGQTTTASVFAITGTATADTGQTISGVTCSGQTVTPDDGAWDEQEEAFTCLANLALGENTLVFIGSDGTRIGSDSVAVTRTAAQQASITNTSISHGVLRH